MASRSYRFLDSFVGDSVLPLFHQTGAPVNGTAGSFAGVALPGALLQTEEPNLYINTGTQASPTWQTSDYNPANAVITGGSINGTLIGGTTPAAVAATTLSTTTKGTFVANGATPVTVAAAGVTANSVVIITLKTVGGTVGAVPAIQTITPTTGFTVAATAGDTSTYNYAIIN